MVRMIVREKMKDKILVIGSNEAIRVCRNLSDLSGLNSSCQESNVNPSDNLLKVFLILSAPNCLSNGIR